MVRSPQLDMTSTSMGGLTPGNAQEMVIDSVAVAVFCVFGLPIFVSTTWAVKEYVPAVVALPEITPVDFLSLRPGGNGADPEANDHL